MASRTPRWKSRHPLCTCPDWTPDFRGTPAPDRTACEGGTIAHPVFDARDLEAMIVLLRGNL